MTCSPTRIRRKRALQFAALAAGCLALANCTGAKKLTSNVDPRYGVTASPRVIQPGEAVPKGGGTYRVGKPYVVAGRTYYPSEDRRYRGEGIASWYGDDFHGRLTANGEVYDMHGVSAAHPTMPMPSYARVTNRQNGRSLIVRVNDRGPFHANRVIDLSSKAAELLDMRRAGTGQVRVEYVGPAALEGSDDRRLMATLREGGPAPAPSNVMVASAKPFVPDFGRTPVPQRRPQMTADIAPAATTDRHPWSTDARAALRRAAEAEEADPRHVARRAPDTAIAIAPPRQEVRQQLRHDVRQDARHQDARHDDARFARRQAPRDSAPALASGRGLY